jgi:hypothetical protein
MGSLLRTRYRNSLKNKRQCHSWMIHGWHLFSHPNLPISCEVFKILALDMNGLQKVFWKKFGVSESIKNHRFSNVCFDLKAGLIEGRKEGRKEGKISLTSVC